MSDSKTYAHHRPLEQRREIHQKVNPTALSPPTNPDARTINFANPSAAPTGLSICVIGLFSSQTSRRRCHALNRAHAAGSDADP